MTITYRGQTYTVRTAEDIVRVCEQIGCRRAA